MATACYVYDAEGRRVQKTTATGTVNYVYDIAGEQVAEVNASGVLDRAEVYAAGRHLATYTNSATYFDHGDWLGTERARSGVNGSICETITSLSFGDGMNTSGSCSDASPMHFTGKQRDGESGVDDFDARYYGSGLGRFMSPDYQDQDEPPDAIPNGSASQPQTLNLYSFVENNPAAKRDTDGHASWQPCPNDSTADCFQGDYNGERYCGFSSGCLFWNGQANQWQRNDPGAPGPDDVAGWWFIGFVRLAVLGDSYGFKQMGYAYLKIGLLPFGGWNLPKPPGVGNQEEAGVRPSIVPDDWIVKPTWKNDGKIYIDPNNPHNRVRVMDDGYMKVQKNGRCLDVNGNEVPSNSPDAHILVNTPMKSPFIDTSPIDIPTDVP
jgi:RHS repeat-associated protein